MEIYFRTRKLQKLCNKSREAVKSLGPRMARVLQLRLEQLKAADFLADVAALPQARCHELTGDLKGHLSVDLVHPYRLLLIPANDPVPRKADAGLDWSRVTEVEVVDIRDTH